MTTLPQLPSSPIVAALVLLASVVPTTSGCASPSAATRSTPTLSTTTLDAKAVSIKAQGYRFVGQRAAGMTWRGTGTVLAPGVLVTNAHVIQRGVQILAGGEGGWQEYGYVRAFSMAHDLAVLSVGPRTPLPREMRWYRPADARRLKGRGVVAVGNTGGFEDSHHRGHIVNIRTDPATGTVAVLHNAGTDQGISGGPLVDQNTGRVLAINVATLGRLDVAVSMEHVAELLDSVRGAAGVTTSRFADPAGVSRDDVRTAQYCVSRGAAETITLTLPQNLDAAITIASLGGGSLSYAFETQGRAVQKGRVGANTTVVWTATRTAEYRLRVSNSAQERRCFHLSVGRLDWEAHLKSGQQEASREASL